MGEGFKGEGSRDLRGARVQDICAVHPCPQIGAMKWPGGCWHWIQGHRGKGPAAGFMLARGRREGLGGGAPSQDPT